MAGYRVTSADFSSEPLSGQSVTIQHKLWSATSYTTDVTGRAVNTDGTLASPYDITGLTSGETYNIKMINECSSPVAYWVKTVTIP